jgi:hypothetical protein
MFEREVNARILVLSIPLSVERYSLYCHLLVLICVVIAFYQSNFWAG